MKFTPTTYQPMKHYLLTFLLFFSSIAIFGQKNGEFGIFAGASYYKGDVNPSKHFYAPLPSMGAFYRHIASEHFAIRMGFVYGLLQGNDLDFNNSFQQNRAHAFNASFIDMGFHVEFNFLPFKAKRFERLATPFVTSGLAYTLASNDAAEIKGYPSIPLGLGVKFAWNQRLTTSLEWTMRKTFLDTIDGIVSVGKNFRNSFIHHNDYIYLTGITIAYKLYEPRIDCPAYQ